MSVYSPFSDKVVLPLHTILSLCKQLFLFGSLIYFNKWILLSLINMLICNFIYKLHLAKSYRVYIIEREFIVSLVIILTSYLYKNNL